MEGHTGTQVAAPGLGAGGGGQVQVEGLAGRKDGNWARGGVWVWRALSLHPLWCLGATGPKPGSATPHRPTDVASPAVLTASPTAACTPPRDTWITPAIPTRCGTRRPNGLRSCPCGALWPPPPPSRYWPRPRTSGPRLPAQRCSSAPLTSCPTSRLPSTLHPRPPSCHSAGTREAMPTTRCMTVWC